MKALPYLFAVFFLTAAHAHDGHDDGVAPAAAGAASPRVTAHSDLFELTGIAQNGQLTVYLDSYATNEPIANARIEFESGETRGTAAPQPDGTYLIKFDALARHEVVPFAFTVTAGQETDLLAGELDLSEAHAHEETAGRDWMKLAAYGAAGLLLCALAFFFARNSRATRKARLNA
ncbi:MAG: hypothetical protein ABW051_00400 [Burkholderiaceae bacterium]